jgi:hypothetical protein
MNEEELKRLIEKYYSGTSTEDEEKALRAFFSENIAPPGYEAEKEIFSYYMDATDIPEPSADFEAGIIKAINSSYGRDRAVKVRRLLVPLLSTAAGLLILIGSYFFFVYKIVPEDTYTDPQLAYAETMKILMDVSTQINRRTRPLKNVGKINEMKVKSIGSINKSAILVEKNLKSLGYLRNSSETKSNSNEKINR